MLVRVDGVAGADGDAHQRFVVGDDERGCGPQPGSDDPGSRGVGYAPL
jgi:hypothetical protein